jgi:hypothetical protein
MALLNGHFDIVDIYLTATVRHPVAVIQYTFTHKQFSCNNIFSVQMQQYHFSSDATVSSQFRCNNIFPVQMQHYPHGSDATISSSFRCNTILTAQMQQYHFSSDATVSSQFS